VGGNLRPGDFLSCFLFFPQTPRSLSLRSAAASNSWHRRERPRSESQAIWASRGFTSRTSWVVPYIRPGDLLALNSGPVLAIPRAHWRPPRSVGLRLLALGIEQTGSGAGRCSWPPGWADGLELELQGVQCPLWRTLQGVGDVYWLRSPHCDAK
jgi:hypothetical protein